MMTICGTGLGWEPPGDGDDTRCCIGSAIDGPGGCTCWVEVYDVDQQEPDLSSRSGARTTLCADCAFRPGSPERSGHPSAAADHDGLNALVESNTPFWCHQGMRHLIAVQHPDGRRVEIPDSLHYPAPVHDGVPYLADGTAGELCAGWLALTLKRVGTR